MRPAAGACLDHGSLSPRRIFARGKSLAHYTSLREIVRPAGPEKREAKHRAFRMGCSTTTILPRRTPIVRRPKRHIQKRAKKRGTLTAKAGNPDRRHFFSPYSHADLQTPKTPILLRLLRLLRRHRPAFLKRRAML